MRTAGSGVRIPYEDSHALDGLAGFRQFAPRVFRSSQSLDAGEFLGRALSASYVPKSGSAYERLMIVLRDIHARFADATGRVHLVYRTFVFSASKLPPERTAKS